MWIDGLLAGMYSRGPQPGTVASQYQPDALFGSATADFGTDSGAAAVTRTVTVLWASQTGTAEELAAAVATRLTDAGFTLGYSIWTPPSSPT